MFHYRGGLGIKGNDLAISRKDAAFLRDSNFTGQLDMFDQMAILAVDRNEEARLHGVEHQLQLFLAGVAGNVHLGHPFMKDFGAAAVEVVDQLRDSPLIAGDDAGRENNGITLFQFDLLMIVHGNAGQGAHRLTLTAGGDDADLFRR